MKSNSGILVPMIRRTALYFGTPFYTIRDAYIALNALSLAEKIHDSIPLHEDEAIKSFHTFIRFHLLGYNGNCENCDWSEHLLEREGSQKAALRAMFILLQVYSNELMKRGIDKKMEIIEEAHKFDVEDYSTEEDSYVLLLS